MPDDLELLDALSRDPALVRRSGRLAERRSPRCSIASAGRATRRSRARGRLGLRAGARGDRRSRACPSGWPRRAVRDGLPTIEQGQLPEYTRGGALPRRPVRRRRSAGSRKAIRLRGGASLSRGLGVPGDGPPPPGASRRGRALARPAARPSAERGPEPVLGRAGDPPAAQRGRGGDPLRPGVPGRPVRALTDLSGVTGGPRGRGSFRSPRPMTPIPKGAADAGRRFPAHPREHGQGRGGGRDPHQGGAWPEAGAGAGRRAGPGDRPGMGQAAAGQLSPGRLPRAARASPRSSSW